MLLQLLLPTLQCMANIQAIQQHLEPLEHPERLDTPPLALVDPSQLEPRGQHLEQMNRVRTTLKLLGHVLLQEVRAKEIRSLLPQELA